MTRILDDNNEFELPVGKYLAVLSHSGSRGMGANIARYYTKLAMDNCWFHIWPNVMCCDFEKADSNMFSLNVL